MGWLNRMTQFKEKAGKDKEKASIGLYVYPVLMAADILLYDTTHVPVGNDQKQHLELCRDIAQKFNNDFGKKDFLKIPEPLIQENFSRIMSLKNGLNKMSKSDPSDASRINLTDNKDQIINKIKKAKTDNLSMPTSKDELRNRPEINNLVEIYSSFTDENLVKSLNNLNGKSFSDLKNLISEILVEQIEPIGKKINELLKDRDYLDKVLLEGSIKANNIADKKVKKLKEIIGLK
jgi:tryptophanyl-tRNA synthetase